MIHNIRIESPSTKTALAAADFFCTHVCSEERVDVDGKNVNISFFGALSEDLLTAISESFPDTLIADEFYDGADIAVTYAKNGRHYTVDASVEFPEFDPSAAVKTDCKPDLLIVEYETGDSSCPYWEHIVMCEGLNIQAANKAFKAYADVNDLDYDQITAYVLKKLGCKWSEFTPGTAVNNVCCIHV